MVSASSTWHISPKRNLSQCRIDQAYSPECLEVKFPEVRIDSPGPTPMSVAVSDRLPEGII